MWRRSSLLATVALGIALLACRSSAPTPTPTATPEASTPTVEVSPTVTATPTVGRLVLAPPDLVLRAAAGEQKATLGPFFWVLDTGFAGEASAPGLVLPSERPLPVKVGEALEFALSEDGAPQKVTLAVYPQEGNFEKIAPDPKAPEGFVAKTEPTVQAEPALQGSTFSWTVPELAPGAYFVRIEIEWPQHPKNPRPDKVPRAVYAFWVQVS